eukprot:1161000-Pelagomonas_calceolata.AAC.2
MALEFPSPTHTYISVQCFLLAFWRILVSCPFQTWQLQKPAFSCSSLLLSQPAGRPAASQLLEARKIVHPSQWQQFNLHSRSSFATAMHTACMQAAALKRCIPTDLSQCCQSTPLPWPACPPAHAYSVLSPVNGADVELGNF